MSNVAITETVKGDVKKFEICCGREVVYIVQVFDIYFAFLHRVAFNFSLKHFLFVLFVSSLSQAPTLEVKVAWLNEIQKILTNPQKLQGFYHLNC